MRDSDFQTQGDPTSEEEVLAPRVDSMSGRTPAPARRAAHSRDASFRPLLLGTALSFGGLFVLSMVGVALVALLWAVL